MIRDLLETSAFDSSQLRFDPENHVIENVAILSLSSQRGKRLYQLPALHDGQLLMEGIKVYSDHPAPADLGKTRRTRDLIGRLTRVRLDRSNGHATLRGDLRLTTHGDWLMEDAKRDPGFYGLSINARGKVHLDRDGRQIIESITLARSVDLVPDPGSTIGLHESLDTTNHDEGKHTMTTTDKLKNELLEAMDKTPSTDDKNALFEISEAVSSNRGSSASLTPEELKAALGG